MEELLRGQNRVLEKLATGDSLKEVLTYLTKTVENSIAGLKCSVLLFDSEKKSLVHGAAPSLPDFYNKAIDGINIGPNVGSCGAAAFSSQTVIVDDVRVHPNWESFRDLAEKADIRACWSQPIISSTKETLGTFALYYREAKSPNKEEVELIQSFAHLAGVAIECKWAEEDLFKVHRELESLVDEKTIELKERTRELEQKNMALKEILGQIEIEKRQIKEDVVSNVEQLLKPTLSKLKRKGNDLDARYLGLLEHNLEKLTSSFGAEVSNKRWRLTPREIEICNMIKNGLSSKEISQLLNVSFRTIEIHRTHIRKKLDIAHKDINLVTYLQSF